MASITSLMGSSSSGSVYGKSNTITGLASGLDTESMVENAVSGLKDKVTALQKKSTKLTWEQEAYREIIDKLSNFANKYTSWDSSTNLRNASFFDSATKVTATGTNQAKVTATGKSSSDIQIHSVQMATAASYSGIMKDTNGNSVAAKSETKLSELLGENFDFENKKLFVNGKEIEVKAEDTLANLAARITTETDIKATFSETTGEFYLKAKETGEGTFSISGELATLFGAATETDGTIKSSEGTNAKVAMTVNGKKIIKDDYKSNQINVDGMIINLKGNFGSVGTPGYNENHADFANATDSVSFTTSVDSDKIVNTIKDFVKDYNEMADSIKDAYATKPLKTSKGKAYEPLSEDDEKDMSESAIERYNEKAKTGLLFADSDVSALYDELRSAISDLGLTDIGLTTAYTSGKTTLVLDETKLRNALESDPDKVKDAFTKGKNGSTDSVMQRLKDTVGKYGYDGDLGKKGILVDLAGYSKAPTSMNNNTYYEKIKDMEDQISRWQDKLLKKVDYYTKQFTQLEKMMSEMNSQSSSLMGLMGGY
ncbi:MAG: flagellar filament capping protein FliD [Oscillospiraceae bacterium]|nr:flagellar filament capping protein FliD [Oscillospiraceae bacterium]